MKIKSGTALRIIVVICITTLISCNNSNKYVISGNITGAKGKALYFNKLSLDGVESIDSVKLGADGEYSFSGERLLEPTFFTLTVESKTITLLNDSNVQMQVNGDFNTLDQNYTVSNSKESENIKQLNNKLRSTISELELLQKRYQNSSSEIEKNNIISEIQLKVDQQKSYIGNFVLKNSFSFASYYAIYQKFDNETFVLNIEDKRDQIYYSTVATSLNALYPNNERVKNLYSYVLKVKQKEKTVRTNELLKTLPSVGFPELTIPDLNGNQKTLSALKGKVILLTFWASWSKESRQFNRELTRVHKKYAGKGLEIYQVSLDQNRLYWEAAIEQDNLQWINVCELTYPRSYAATIYNISNLPANYLINKKGDIVGRNLSGDLLDEKIQMNL